MNFWLNIYSVFLFTALLTASVRANSFSEGFSSKEQRHLFSDFDYDTSENLGVYLSEFFHDSQSQLVVDLDLVREIWSELARYREATLEGDVDYIQVRVSFYGHFFQKIFLLQLCAEKLKVQEFYSLVGLEYDIIKVNDFYYTVYFGCEFSRLPFLVGKNVTNQRQLSGRLDVSRKRKIKSSGSKVCANQRITKI